jgi:hypothetical protein
MRRPLGLVLLLVVHRTARPARSWEQVQAQFGPTASQVGVSEIWEAQGAVLKPLPPDQEGCTQHQHQLSGIGRLELAALDDPGTRSLTSTTRCCVTTLGVSRGVSDESPGRIL